MRPRADRSSTYELSHTYNLSCCLRANRSYDVAWAAGVKLTSPCRKDFNAKAKAPRTMRARFCGKPEQVDNGNLNYPLGEAELWSGQGRFARSVCSPTHDYCAFDEQDNVYVGAA